jgi:hypothetical protein
MGARWRDAISLGKEDALQVIAGEYCLLRVVTQVRGQGVLLFRLLCGCHITRLRAFQ